MDPSARAIARKAGVSPWTVCKFIRYGGLEPERSRGRINNWRLDTSMRRQTRLKVLRAVVDLLEEEEKAAAQSCQSAQLEAWKAEVDLMVAKHAELTAQRQWAEWRGDWISVDFLTHLIRNQVDELHDYIGRDWLKENFPDWYAEK